MYASVAFGAAEVAGRLPHGSCKGTNRGIAVSHGTVHWRLRCVVWRWRGVVWRWRGVVCAGLTGTADKGEVLFSMGRRLPSMPSRRSSTRRVPHPHPLCVCECLRVCACARARVYVCTDATRPHFAPHDSTHRPQCVEMLSACGMGCRRLTAVCE